MRSRRFLRLILIVVGVIVVLIGGAIGLIHTSTAKQLVFAQIQKILHNQGVDLEAADFDYNLVALRISSTKLSVRSVSAPQLPSLFTADYLMAEIDLFELLAGRYRVKDAIITNPRIQIVVDEQGSSNLPSSTTSTGEPVDWLVLKLRSTGGSLSFEDRSQNVFVNLPEWDLSVNGSGFTGTQEIHFQTQQLAEARYSAKTINARTIDALLTLKDRNETLDVRQASISSDLADLAIIGTVRNLNDPILDVEATSKIHLERASHLLSIAQKLEGDLNIEASLKGRPNELKVAGRIKGENLTAESINQIILDANVAGDLAAQRAQINSFQMWSPALSVSGTADLALAANAGESRVDATLDAANLERFSRILKLPVTVASRASGYARVRWAGTDFARGLDGNGRLQFAARPRDAGLRRIPLSGAITVRADKNKTVASIDSLEAGALHLRGQLSLAPSKQLSGTIRLDASDTGEALRQMANWFGTTPVGLQILGSTGVDANLSGTLDHPRVLGTLQANNLRVNDLRDIDFEAVAEYTPEQLDLQKLTVDWEQQSLIASGRMNLTTPSPTLDARAEVPNASIARILAALGQANVPAAGNIGLAAQISGTVASPAARLSISASDLEAYGEAFGTLSAEARFANQLIQLDNLSLDKLNDGRLQASGQYELTTRTYAVKANSSELKLRRLILPDGTPITANLSLNADGSGTFENPGGVLKLSARDVQVGSDSIGSIDVDANAADHRAQITATAPAYAVTANAIISTVHPHPAEIEVRATETDISRLPRQVKDLSGRVSAIVNASGNLTDVNNARVHAEVPSFTIAWLNRVITGDGPIELEYADREIKISRAAVRIEDSSVRISGNLPLDADATGEVKIEGRTNLATLSELIPSETPVNARGELNLNGSLRGNLKRINPNATITISDGSLETSMLPAPLLGLNLKAALTDGRLIIEQLDGEWASAKIIAHGEVPFALLPDLPIEIPRPAVPAKLSLEVQQFKLSALTKPPQNADAIVSLRVEAAASRPEIDALEARLTFPELRLDAGVYSLEQVGTSTIAVRNGVASVERFELKGPQTNIHLTGNAALRESGPIELTLEGNTDAAVIALFDNDIKATGDTRLNVSVSGTMRQPDLNGFVELQNGQGQIPDPRIAAENFQLRLDLNRNEIKLTRLEGSLNGGSIKGEGHVSLSEDQMVTAEMRVTADGVYLEFPTGLRTVSNAQLNLQGDLRRLLLSGNIDVTEGTYTDRLTIERGLFRYLESQQSTIILNDQPSLLSRTQLDVAVRTLSPLFLNNNVARANINAELRLLGTLEQPGLTGRIDLEEGAQINLRERKYSVDRGIITFTNDHAIEPILDIAATTKVSTYNITMQISGNATGKLETVLTSEPPKPEADIVSLLATGRLLEKAGEEGTTTIAKEQVLSYVAGELGTSVTEGAGRALGLSQVRIEPNLIANETDPTARLTLGKDITPKLDFVYSMNLRDSNDQIWITDYAFTRRFSARGLRQNDNSYRFQFQHDVFFGLTGESSKPRTSTTRGKIRSIQFLGDTHLTQDQLASAAGLKTGKTYDFFSVEKARTQLEKTFAKQDRLEARISADKKLEDSAVDLTLRVKEGPKVEFVFQGWNVPSDLKDQIRDAWGDGVIDGQRVTDVVDLIESQLIRDGHFGSQIDSSIEQLEPDTKRITFKIQPGIQYNDVRVAFDGVRAIKEEELQLLLKQGGFFDRDLKKRKQAVPLIENLYKERGYIDVNVDPPRNELHEESKTVRIVFRVTEGPLYRFGRVSFTGNAEFTEADLMSRSSIPAEGPFEFKLVQQTQQKVQDLYRKAGYNDVAVQYTQLKDVPKSIVDVTFNIQENSQRILKDIDVEGIQNTSSNLVRTQIDLKPGDVVGYDKLSQARSNLYNTGAYSFVEIVAMPLPDRTEIKPNQTAVRLIARVREVEPWQLRYGGFYDTERGPGGILDFSNHNMLGGARVIGLQTRYDSDLHEVRTYFSQPTLRRLPVKAVFTAFQRREIHTDDDPLSQLDDFTADRFGFSPSLEYRPHKNNVVTFGYRFEKTHTFHRIPDPVADGWRRVAPLSSSFTRDTRDDPLDASHGRFTSHAFEWGMARLGSELRYWKYFGQYFAYFPLSKPTLVPWAHTTRSRLVVALGARLGMSKALGGDEIPQSERFLAGGGTTVRGFEQDKLGPLDPLGAPIGGDAMLVINSELRFPLFKFFDGIAFVDTGNVYRHLSDFKPFDVRSSYGVGLRVRTPYIVLRLDYGLKFSPRPGEHRGKFFGSIGQAF